MGKTTLMLPSGEAQLRCKDGSLARTFDFFPLTSIPGAGFVQGKGSDKAAEGNRQLNFRMTSVLDVET
jgi:hypothetical protein